MPSLVAGSPWLSANPAFLKWWRKNAAGLMGQRPGGLGGGTRETDDALYNWAHSKWLSSMTPEEIMAGGYVKNKTLQTIYGSVKNALEGPPLYSENDIRNQGLAIAQGGNIDWQNTLPQMQAAAEATGMGDSGFFENALGKAAAANQMRTESAITQTANTLRQENEGFRQQRISDSMGLLSMFLNSKRRGRLAAMQMANYLNSMNTHAGPNVWTSAGAIGG